ncbi:metal-dependent hydrolase [Paenibacillus peoriae]|uniref:metal-dependent hydrolase n=1 Tax=Paenibacillus peoriae TaxID=59893 RepID=UPI00026C59BC|nr:metal-dependent hydrolase [Paenibacillus peoriae]MEC0182129.1 metal-dependent hydrolase [Paenibacillus peoriae]
MDTATHFVMGVGLAGLAYTDPAVAGDPKLAAVILLATVVGSQAPDFDTLFRLKNNAAYIRNHRGLSHSIPFWFIWILSITGLICLIFRDVSAGHVALWVTIAVCLHVFTDLFNTYGTQAFRPFTDKWISWNIIHIFDPFIFGTHVAAIMLWITGLIPPTPLFITLYVALGLYYIWRTWNHFRLKNWVRDMDDERRQGNNYYIIPTVSWNRWHVVKAHQNGSYDIGRLNGKHLFWTKHAVPSTHPAAEASKSYRDVQSFRYFSSFAVAEVEELEWGYVVRWADVRYRHRKQYPFVAVVAMDKEFKLINSYIGWLSHEKMQKRLSLHTN